MPSTDVYGKRDLVAVTAIAGAAWKYGFRSNTSATERSDLGQIPAINANGYIPGLLVGVSAPKPAILRKFATATGYDGSYCSAANIDTALADGYKLVKPIQRRFGKRTKAARTVFVPVQILDEAGEPNGAPYKMAWTMPDFLYEKISASLVGLGIEVSDGAEQDLIWGVDKQFQPRKAERLFSNADNTTSVNRTFVAPAKYNNLPTGWSLI